MGLPTHQIGILLTQERKMKKLFFFSIVAVTGISTAIICFQPGLKSAPSVQTKKSLLTASADQLDQGVKRWVMNNVHVQKEKKDKMSFSVIYNQKLSCEDVKNLGTPSLGEGGPKQLLIYKANNEEGIPIDHRGPIGYVNTTPYKYLGVVVDLNSGKVAEYETSNDGSNFKAILKDSSLPEPKSEKLPDNKKDLASNRDEITGAKDITSACKL